MDGFNKKFIDNWSLLTSSTIGLELEFFTDYSYVKLLEMLNAYFADSEKFIWGFSTYHPNFTPTDKEFCITPDYSGGASMVEFITGPMSYVEARIILLKMLKFIDENGWTDDNSSIHINISFKDQNLQMENLNPLKLILSLNEEVIYQKFPNRRNNIYCQSISWIIPFTDFPDAETAVNRISTGLILPDDTKYYGVNLQKKNLGWLEWRYIGGKDYHQKLDDILELMDYFILITKTGFDPVTEEDNIKLFSYLDNNIAWYAQYSTYDEFLSNIEGINIQYDGDGDISIISENWPNIKDKLFRIIKMSKAGSIKGGMFNYNSSKGRFEIVNAIIQDMYTVKEVDFVECKIYNITAHRAVFADCEVEASHIWNCEIHGTTLVKCKITGCKVKDNSELDDCMFDGESIEESVMKNGVFRSGKILDNVEIEASVKMANKSAFWHVYDPHSKKVNPIKKKEL